MYICMYIYIYIYKFLKKPSAKYYQENKERLQKNLVKDIKVLLSKATIWL